MHARKWSLKSTRSINQEVKGKREAITVNARKISELKKEQNKTCVKYSGKSNKWGLNDTGRASLTVPLKIALQKQKILCWCLSLSGMVSLGKEGNYKSATWSTPRWFAPHENVCLSSPRCPPHPTPSHQSLPQALKPFPILFFFFLFLNMDHEFIPRTSPPHLWKTPGFRRTQTSSQSSLP